jgi:hypothetical protein
MTVVDVQAVVLASPQVSSLLSFGRARLVRLTVQEL